MGDCAELTPASAPFNAWHVLHHNEAQWGTFVEVEGERKELVYQLITWIMLTAVAICARKALTWWTFYHSYWAELTAIVAIQLSKI